MSHVGYNNSSFICDQIILIPHDSGVLCKLHILDLALFYCLTQLLFLLIRFHVVKCNASLLCQLIATIRPSNTTVVEYSLKCGKVQSQNLGIRS